MKNEIVHIGAGELNYGGGVYYLIGAAGICVVPLSSFNTDLQGFRFTLLEQNELKFRKTMETLATSMKEYLESAHITEAHRKRAQS